MTSRSPVADAAVCAGLPEPGELLRVTDWATLEHGGGPAGDVPAALAALLDADPVVQVRALRCGLAPLRHQNSIYPATVPAALYIAAILPDPRVDTPGTYRPLRAGLLDWLGALGFDADDAAVAACERHGFCEHPEEDAVRAVRPALFHAVAAFLGDDDQDVRHAALTAAIPLIEDPRLARHRANLIPYARDILESSDDPQYRNRAADWLSTWAES